ncbi:hypothetical protein [Telmatospirillum sp. J64-1]|uniref:hypothetical protein n=1 Tax=Telmatospirillum sp. J64-1 TaxID=2502183 RepID=UPI00115EAFCC|nr:hypothetical protein [Telmatospirillum sp. J64-1]
MVVHLGAHSASAPSLSWRNGQAGQDKPAPFAQERDEKAEKALQALEHLRRTTSKPSETRKAAAKAKLLRLKEQIRMLRMFSFGDPKAIARQAKRLARELSSAAAAYGAEGGGSVTVASAASVPSGQQQAEQQAAASRPENAGKAEAEAQAAIRQAETKDKDGEERKILRPTKDEEFILLARRLSKELKAIMQKQALRLRQQAGKDTPEAREVEALARKTELAVMDAERNLRKGGPAVLSLLV